MNQPILWIREGIGWLRQKGIAADWNGVGVYNPPQIQTTNPHQIVIGHNAVAPSGESRITLEAIKILVDVLKNALHFVFRVGKGSRQW